MKKNFTYDLKVQSPSNYATTKGFKLAWIVYPHNLDVFNYCSLKKEDTLILVGERNHVFHTANANKFWTTDFCTML